jgi:hypothetical protein
VLVWLARLRKNQVRMWNGAYICSRAFIKVRLCTFYVHPDSEGSVELDPWKANEGGI